MADGNGETSRAEQMTPEQYRDFAEPKLSELAQGVSEVLQAMPPDMVAEAVERAAAEDFDNIYEPGSGTVYRRLNDAQGSLLRALYALRGDEPASREAESTPSPAEA